MTALSQALPGPNHPLVGRSGYPSPVWYPWFVRMADMINGIANGELIVDGAISSRTLSTGAVTADAIAANAITTDKIDANNIDVLDGTFGTLKTNDTTTRVQITDADNEMRCYVDGVLIASIGANVISNGAFVAATSPSADWYPAEFSNSSATGGSTGEGGGALVLTSVGGVTLECNIETQESGNFAGVFYNRGNWKRVAGTHQQVFGGSIVPGGQAALGASVSDGGFSFFDANGGGYGPFTGTHYGAIKTGTTVEPGDILVDCETLGRSMSDALTIVEPCSRANEPAIGAYVLTYPLKRPQFVAETVDLSGLECCKINALGEGCINVCGLGGNIAKGDLIVTSTVPGKGMRQADDIVRSYTVARAREAVTFASPTATAQIACIYLSG